MGENGGLKVTWYGHSCFLIECSGYRVVIDPYSPGSVPGYAALDLNANQVLYSHNHRDHCWKGIHIVDSQAENPFFITKVHTYHDDKQGSLRGTNIIHLIEGNGTRIAHMGDLGCELSEDQIKQIGKLDVILIPVGGYYTIDAKQAQKLLEKLDVEVVIPMHYRTNWAGYPEIDVLEEFTKLRDDVKEYDSNTIVIAKGMGKQTAVLFQ